MQLGGLVGDRVDGLGALLPPEYDDAPFGEMVGGQVGSLGALRKPESDDAPYGEFALQWKGCEVRDGGQGDVQSASLLSRE